MINNKRKQICYYCVITTIQTTREENMSKCYQYFSDGTLISFSLFLLVYIKISISRVC